MPVQLVRRLSVRGIDYLLTYCTDFFRILDISCPVPYAWKASNGKANWSDIWGSWVSVAYIWRTFDLVTLKVIFGSFGGFIIIRTLGLMIIDGRKHLEWL